VKITTFQRGQDGFPQLLQDRLTDCPSEVSLSGPLEDGIVVGIVGTRRPCDGARAFARALAGEVSRAGGIVASGAALGIDTAAHEGALAAGGRTWAIAPSGSDRVVPPSNIDLYRRIRQATGSAVLWPFARGVSGRRHTFLARNGVLAALSNAVVIVQAGAPSGALNTAKWARELGVPVWVVLPAPWDARRGGIGAAGHVPSDDSSPDFRGTQAELERGAKVLFGIKAFLEEIGLAPGSGAPPRQLTLPRTLDERARRVLDGVISTPRHTDEIVAKVGLDAPTVTTALLTLALENVVVEGPGGFFRRTIGA
jgi:DNA processing protein